MIQQKYIYSIKHDSGTFFLETVATSREQAERMIMNAELCPINSLTIHSIEPLYEVTRIKNASNGSARFVVHYLSFLTSKEKDTLSYDEMRKRANERANRIGYKKYKHKGVNAFYVISTCLGENQLYEQIEKEKQKQ